MGNRTIAQTQTDIIKETKHENYEAERRLRVHHITTPHRLCGSTHNVIAMHV